MSFVGSNILAGASGQGDAGYKIERSLRFNSADSAYLNRTPSSAGNRKTWTWSGWVKRSQLTVSGEYIFTCSAAGNDYTTLHFGSSDDKLNFQGNNGSGSLQFNLQTTAVFRDPSAWYHIVLSVDSTQATDSNKVKIYVNGELQTFSTATYPPDNFAFRINTTQEHRIGSLSSQSTYLDSYLADVHFIDGQALAPTDFGKLDDNSVWQPKEFTGSYTSTNTSTTLSQTGWTVSTPTSENTIWDGNTSTQSNGHNGGTIGTVSFSPALTNVTKVEVYQQDYVHYLNGSQVTTSQSGTGWHTLYDSSSPITLSSVGNAYTNNTQTVDIMAIRINDSIVDSKTWTPPSGVGVQNTGVNSFYLKLADNSSNAALGTDSSGNSNTWTVNNISGPGGDADYASMVTQGSDGGYNAGSEAATAFDGSLTTAPNTSASNNNGNITFTPSPSISHTTSIRAYWKWGNSSATYSYNGGSNTSITASGWITLASGSGTFTSLNTYRGGDGQFFSAIEIDGTILISSTGADNDSLIDTPTNYDDGTNVGGNYATLNPLTKSSSASTLTNGNLDFDVTAGGVWSSALGTIAFTTEKIYFETTLVKVNSSTGCNAAGAVVAVRRLADQANWAISGNDNYTVRFTDNGCYKNGAATATNGVQASGGNVAAGDVIGFAIDGTNGTYGIYRNGVVQASGSIGITGYSSGDALIPFVAGFPDGGGYTYGKFSKFNFGQRPFAYTPPTGYKSLCTTNLPDPTIADGSTVFDAVAYTGNGSSKTISGVGFSSDLIWTKCRNQARSHYLMDTVRGISKYLISEQTSAEGTNTTNRILSVTSDGWTLGTNNSFNGNNDTYVAWTWDGGTVGTNEVGDYWSPPTYQTKYIAFKFPTSSGGRAVFGLIAGTGTADIYTSSDNNSWTRVQSNVTLSTTDTTYDSTSQYLIVVNTTDAVWANRHYAMATNGTDAHYSTSVYPGSGASFTWSGPAYSDWDFRSSGTAIRPGSLNSSVYDQSRTWSGGTSSGTMYSGAWTQVFNNVETNTYNDGNSVYVYQNTATLNFSPALPTGAIQIWGRAGSSSASGDKVTFSDGTNTYTTGDLSNQTAQWIDVDSGNSLSGITSVTVHSGGSSGAGMVLGAIRVGGKKLVNSSISASTPSIASTVRANPSAGFSIVTYTGNATSGSTVGHGLNATPKMVIYKNRNDASAWRVYNTMADGSLDILYLNTTAAKTDSGLATFTSSVFTVGSSNDTNGSGDSLIAYCFAPVEGYSAFGSYTGNGSTDGPFVYTGMRPRWIMGKRTDSTNDWFIYDTARETFNVQDQTLYANLNAAEDSGGYYFIDILSNGFKLKSTYAKTNGSGATYIYAAFAEHPFKTARAR